MNDTMDKGRAATLHISVNTRSPLVNRARRTLKLTTTTNIGTLGWVSRLTIGGAYKRSHHRMCNTFKSRADATNTLNLNGTYVVLAIVPVLWIKIRGFV